MKSIKNMLLAAFVVFSISISAQNTATTPIHRCGTVHYTEVQKANNPGLAEIMEQDEIDLTNYIKANQNTDSKVIITIPVVVHVIYNSAVPSQNISTAQIISQINVLNKDFRRLNSDSSSTPAPWKSLAADCQIEFCLARQDPNGNPTLGITRTQTTKSTFDISSNECKFTAQGGKDAWDRNKYLNLWVVPDINDNGESGILGYAQFPGGSATTDGVVIGYEYFGTNGTASYPYNKGRTTTHEVGHFFNLRHIWGDDGNACWGDDQVGDTPNQASENYDAPTYPLTDACATASPGVMFMNYMDYTDDRAMNIFTVGQRTRMLGVLNTNATRTGLKTSTGCVVVGIEEPTKNINFTIFPNPATESINLHFDSELLVENLSLEIYNSLGALVFKQDFGNQNFIHQSIDLHQFNDGVYFVKIASNNSIETKTFIKLKQ